MSSVDVSENFSFKLIHPKNGWFPSFWSLLTFCPSCVEGFFQCPLFTNCLPHSGTSHSSESFLNPLYRRHKLLQSLLWRPQTALSIFTVFILGTPKQRKPFPKRWVTMFSSCVGEWNVSNTLLVQCHRELRPFWREIGANLIIIRNI